MQKRETKNYDQSATSGRGKARETARAGRKGYSKRSSKASSQSRGKGRRVSGGKKRQRGQRQTAYKIDERLYTKEEVSLIVRNRVKRLSERIDALELENSILLAEKELNELAKRENRD